LEESLGAFARTSAAGSLVAEFLVDRSVAIIVKPIANLFPGGDSTLAEQLSFLAGIAAGDADADVESAQLPLFGVFLVDLEIAVVVQAIANLILGEDCAVAHLFAVHAGDEARVALPLLGEAAGFADVAAVVGRSVAILIDTVAEVFFGRDGGTVGGPGLWARDSPGADAPFVLEGTIEGPGGMLADLVADALVDLGLALSQEFAVVQCEGLADVSQRAVFVAHAG